MVVMTKPTVACFLFFVTAVVAPAQSPGGLSFAFSTAPGMSVGSEPRFAGAEGSFTLPSLLQFHAEIGKHWSWHLAAGYRYTAPSPPGVNEVSLRGHNDLALGAGAGYRWPPLLERGIVQLRPAVELTAYTHIAAYQYTSIYFFYPSIEVEPSLRILRWYNDFLSFSAGVPLRYDVRRDLDFSFALGLSLSLSIYLPE